MSTSRSPEIEALETLRFAGEPQPEVVRQTKEVVMKHCRPVPSLSRAARRSWIAGTFLVALSAGAVAGPRLLEWWERVQVRSEVELPGGQRHVVLEDEEGNVVLDSVLKPDEALFHIEPEDGGEGAILTVTPLEPEDDSGLGGPR